MFTVVALVVSVFVAAVSPSPTGAPTLACETLEPQHGTTPQTTPSPYAFTAANNGDGTYRVTVTKTDATAPDFKGVIIQARLVDTTVPLGGFSITDTTNFHTIDCSAPADTVTHSNNSTKPTGSFTWTGDGGDVTGISFTGAVVQQHQIYWTRIKSQDLETLP